MMMLISDNDLMQDIHGVQCNNCSISVVFIRVNKLINFGTTTLARSCGSRDYREVPGIRS